jgi:hypothetical protein
MGYLKIKTHIALENIITLEEKAEREAEIQSEKEVEEKLEALLDEVKTHTLSSSDTRKVDEKIVQIQKNIYSHVSKNLITLRDELEKLTNAKQK